MASQASLFLSFNLFEAMKSLSFILCFCMVILFSGCIKEIDITAEGQETTIIYGLLDVNQSKNYVRIQKAFLDKERSALEMAQVSDSIYYTNILKVTLTDLSNGNVFNLSKVDGDTAGIPKDSGIFSNTPNVLYSLDAGLSKDHRYKLAVTNTKSGNEAFAELNLANSPRFLFPFSGLQIGIVDTIPYTIKWQSAPYDKVYDVIVRFNYSEKDLTTNATIFKSYEYIALKGVSGANLSGGETIERKINKTDIYKRLASSLRIDNNLERRVDPTKTLEFVLYAAGDEFDKYLQVKNAQGGITSISYLPIYTNVNNGLGILSSRTVVTATNITLNQISRDSLAFGSYTKELGFLP